MALSGHVVHVFAAQSYLAASGQPSVAVGVGMTTGGKLCVFNYAAETDTFTVATWPATLAAEIPHHAAVTADGGTLRLYVNYLDGASTVTVSAAPPPGKPTAAAIGGVFVGAGSPYNQLNTHRASLGQFAFWRRTLSSAEVISAHSPLLAIAPGGETETQRMNEVLDYVGWPSSWRTWMRYIVGDYDFCRGAVDPSTCEALMPPKWDGGATALELLQRAASAVDGLVYMGADGTVTYQGRFRRQGTVAAATFRESDGTAIEGDFAYQIDDNDITNKVTATAANGLAFEWRDDASIALYGERAKTADWDLLYASDLLNAAKRLVNRCKTPVLRCPTITVDVAATPDALQCVFDLDIGVTVALDDLPATAPADVINVIIESVGWDIDATTGDWNVTYEVSPGSTYTFFTLDSASYGVLDTSRLGDS